MRAFRVAYDGRSYYGFQRQPTVSTVEDTLLDAVRGLDLAPEGGLPPGYAAAGRTDRGVSALAQTVGFRCPEWCSPGALNSQLPAAIRVWAAADVDEDFHATHDAAVREYTYWLYGPRLDDGRATAALEALCGEHDFHNLTPDTRGTVRDLNGSVDRVGDFLRLRLVADGFVRQLVRQAVSVVRRVADGEPLALVDRVLAPSPLVGRDGIAPAAAEPLVLTDVSYPDVEFVVDEDAAETARTLFHERAVDGAVRERVAGAIRDGVGADGRTGTSQ